LSLSKINQLSKLYSFDSDNIDLARDKRDGSSLTKSAMSAYQAWIGYYSQYRSRCSDKTKVCETWNIKHTHTHLYIYVYIYIYIYFFFSFFFADIIFTLGVAHEI
jgi:preprotein translocase subunit SecY